jgi:hypothetical protein
LMDRYMQQLHILLICRQWHKVKLDHIELNIVHINLFIQLSLPSHHQMHFRFRWL